MDSDFSSRGVLTACALRFDGHRYVEKTGFDGRQAVEEYFRTKSWKLTAEEKLATFFLLQRSLCKWDLVYEPYHGRWWRAFRSLFLEVVDLEVPEGYSKSDYVDRWKADYEPVRQQCIDTVKQEIESLNRSMRALSIRQPHAEAIMRGTKIIEFRSRATKIRGRIYIYASLGRYSATNEAEMMADYGIDDVTCG